MTVVGVRKAVQDLWFCGPKGWGTRLLLAFLAPVQYPFRLAVGVRNAWYDRKAQPPLVLPVISVGNLTVGGTGKTPVIRWLRDWLSGTGVKVAVVTRGYGGDEDALYRRWFDPDTVFAGADRKKQVHDVHERGYELALLDDGFQHRSLGRSLDILLVAAEDSPRVRLLPGGPYREPLSAARRATHVLVVRRTAPPGAAAVWRKTLARVVPGVPVLDVEMEMGGWSDLAGTPARPPRGGVLATCAIARPKAFAIGLERMLPDAKVELLSFADHHAYTARDVSTLLSRRGDRTIVCTAKDAVKLASFGELRPHCTVVGFQVTGEPEEPLRGALAEVVRNPCSFP